MALVRRIECVPYSAGSRPTSSTQDERSREPALITFLVTASGQSLAGIGAAFWGVVAGNLALAVQH